MSSDWRYIDIRIKRDVTKEMFYQAVKQIGKELNFNTDLLKRNEGGIALSKCFDKNFIESEDELKSIRIIKWGKYQSLQEAIGWPWKSSNNPFEEEWKSSQEIILRTNDCLTLKLKDYDAKNSYWTQDEKNCIKQCLSF